MAVPKLEVLLHTKVSITGPNQTGTVEVRPPTADEKWTLKYFMVQYDLAAVAGGATGSYKLEIIDQAAVADALDIDTDAASNSTKSVQKLFGLFFTGVQTVAPFPVFNMTVTNDSFLRFTLTSNNFVSAPEVQLLNVFITGLKRPI